MGNEWENKIGKTTLYAEINFQSHKIGKMMPLFLSLFVVAAKAQGKWGRICVRGWIRGRGGFIYWGRIHPFSGMIFDFKS